MKKYVLPALTGLLLAAFAFAGTQPLRAQNNAAPDADAEGYIPFVRADNPLGWNIDYIFTADKDDPSYQIAFKAMMPTYKGKLDYNPIPLIGLAQTNLNQNPMPEMIALPTEEFEETGKFCDLNGLCPHYVIEVQGNKAVTLGVLYGWKVNKGKRILNGYFTLEVYSIPSKETQFEEFAYDPKTKEYKPAVK